MRSTEQAWNPMASSSVNFCRKARTVHSTQCYAIDRDQTVAMCPLMGHYLQAKPTGTSEAGPSTRARCRTRASPSLVRRQTAPSVVGPNLPYQQPVRGVHSREECYWSHACSLQTCVRSNGILECNFLSENAHRTSTIIS
jgi:hypothetical protein